MAYRIEQRIDIEAPADLVWTIVQDPMHRPRWDARVTSARILGGTVDEGCRFHDRRLPSDTRTGDRICRSCVILT